MDVKVFNQEMEKQKNRSRNATKVVEGEWITFFEDDIEEFVGYSRLECEVKISKYRKVIIQDKDLYHLVFNLTPFYPEGGGQVGDIGIIESFNETIEILDTKTENKLIIHVTEKLPKNLKSEFKLFVKADRRLKISINHSSNNKY